MIFTEESEVLPSGRAESKDRKGHVVVNAERRIRGVRFPTSAKAPMRGAASSRIA
jgi:hypothetical protein